MERLVARNEITLVFAESRITEFFRLPIQLCVDVGNSEQSCCCKVKEAPLTEGASYWRRCSPFAAAKGFEAVADCLWRSVVPTFAPPMGILYDSLWVSARLPQHSVTIYDAATFSGTARTLQVLPCAGISHVRVGCRSQLTHLPDWVLSIESPA